MKSKHSYLLLVSAGAILSSGCGSSSQPATSPDVPSAVETTPASPLPPETTPAPAPASAAPSAPTAKP